MPGTEPRFLKNMPWAFTHPVYRSAVSALVYVAVCTAYIFLSGRIAAGLAKTTEQLQIIETVKGSAFIIVSGIAFFFISLGWWKKTRRQGELLLQSERRAVAAMYSAAVVHDLNNLLMSLSVLLEEIRRQEEDKIPSKRYMHVEHGIRNLTQLSKRITSSARQLQTREKEPVDLPALLLRITALVQKHPDVRICSLTLPDIPHVRLFIQTELFEQAVMNLIINAAQAAGKGGKIELAFEKTKKALIMEVHDNGPGVSPDQAETIFDPGFTTKTGGTGLGLLSVQAFISSCNGKISMDRSPLGGAVFRLIMPVREEASAMF